MYFPFIVDPAYSLCKLFVSSRENVYSLTLLYDLHLCRFLILVYQTQCLTVCTIKVIGGSKIVPVTRSHLWVRFLFLCSFRVKFSQLRDWHLHFWSWRPSPVWEILDPPLKVILTSHLQVVAMPFCNLSKMSKSCVFPAAVLLYFLLKISLRVHQKQKTTRDWNLSERCTFKPLGLFTHVIFWTIAIASTNHYTTNFYNADTLTPVLLLHLH